MNDTIDICVPFGNRNVAFDLKIGTDFTLFLQRIRSFFKIQQVRQIEVRRNDEIIASLSLRRTLQYCVG